MHCVVSDGLKNLGNLICSIGGAIDISGIFGSVYISQVRIVETEALVEASSLVGIISEVGRAFRNTGGIATEFCSRLHKNCLEIRIVVHSWSGFVVSDVSLESMVNLLLG